MTGNRGQRISVMLPIFALFGCGPSLSVVPASVGVGFGGRVAFSVAPSHSGAAVEWSVMPPGGGTIDSAGVYTAPAQGGQFTVVAVDPRTNARATADVAVFDDLVDRGAPVLSAVRVYPVLWGDQQEFASDIVPAIEAFALQLNASPYLALLNEYLRGSPATAAFGALLTDDTAPPTGPPPTLFDLLNPYGRGWADSQGCEGPPD